MGTQRDINANIRDIIYHWEIKHKKFSNYIIYNDFYAYNRRSVKLWGYNYSKDINEHVCSKLIKLGYGCEIRTIFHCTNTYNRDYIKNSQIKKEKIYETCHRLIITITK